MLNKRTVLITFCVFVMFLWGCSNPKELQITEKNKETLLKSIQSSQKIENAKDDFLKEIKGIDKLSADESKVFLEYIDRYAFGEKLKVRSDDKMPLVGKTVGELIELQKQWETERAIRQAALDKLAEETKAKEEASLKKLRDALSLTLYKKGFELADPENGEYRDYITFGITYQNNSNKDIRAFQGALDFQDLFGESVLIAGIKIMDPIKAGGKANWPGTISYNQFKETHIRLKNLDFNDIKAVWIPEKIIFSDGTTLPEQNENTKN